MKWGDAGRHRPASPPQGVSPGERQLSFVPPDIAALVHLMRENQRLMWQLASRFEVLGLAPALLGPEAIAIQSPEEVADYLGPELRSLAQEQLRAVLLDIKLHVLGTPLIYQGGLNATAIRVADCFREAVRLGADSLVLVHNHPSGDPTPSPQDVRLTADAARAGELLGIPVLDHIVVGRPSHVSLRQRGLYRPEDFAGDRPETDRPETGRTDVLPGPWPGRAVAGPHQR